MFKSIRTTIKALLAIALLGPAITHAATQPLDRVAVIVNDDIIMQSQVQQAINSAIANLQKRNQPMPPKQILIQQVVENLIMESIQLQIAERGGIRIDDTSLNEAVERIAEKNNMTLEQFRQTLAAEGTDYAAVREQIRREMITNRTRQGSVGPRIQITDQEIENFLNSSEGQELLKSQYRLGHILLAVPENASSKKRDQVAAQAENLYQQLKGGADFASLARQYSASDTAEQGGDLGWRKEDEIPSLFKNAIKDLATGDVSQPIASGNGYHLVKLLEQRGGESQLQHQMQVRHILIQTNEIRSASQAEELIYDLFTRIQAGEDFAELARLYSNDPGSRAKGGDLGWITSAGLVPAFIQAMEETPVGTMSAPFQSRFGWHILEKLDERDHDLGAEASKRIAREAIFKRKFNEELELWLREIRNDAFVDIKI